MQSPENTLQTTPRYSDILGREQAIKLLNLFFAIDKGKYDKSEVYELHVKNLAHPLFIRAIRADMQSFVNTFIDPYMEKKEYLAGTEFVIDAGANIGCTAVLYANWWPQAKIISIEPDRENYELTVKNTRPYKNITVVNAALWHSEAKLSIEAGQEDGFVVREVNDGDKKVKPENLTNGVSLNGLLKQYDFPRIDFLKMNIEGSEKEVFTEHYEEWLAKTKSMLIELHDGKNAGCSKAVFSAVLNFDMAVTETAGYGILFAKERLYRSWYSKWYKEQIYQPNINKERFPEIYFDREKI
jgi:FkbM family methyltransferase